MYSFLQNKNEDFPNYKAWGSLHLMSELPDFFNDIMKTFFISFFKLSCL